MATETKNLSEYQIESIEGIENLKIGIITSQWNESITKKLHSGAKKTLLDVGIKQNHILEWNVPGSYELIFASNQICKTNKLDALITIGSVIRGETAHFDFVCQAVSQGIKDVNLKYEIPVIFCLLTDNTMEQAIDRSSGKHGNKGVEAAVAALKMITVKQEIWDF